MSRKTIDKGRYNIEARYDSDDYVTRIEWIPKFEKAAVRYISFHIARTSSDHVKRGDVNKGHEILDAAKPVSSPDYISSIRDSFITNILAKADTSKHEKDMLSKAFRRTAVKNQENKTLITFDFSLEELRELAEEHSDLFTNPKQKSVLKLDPSPSATSTPVNQG